MIQTVREDLMRNEEGKTAGSCVSWRSPQGFWAFYRAECLGLVININWYIACAWTETRSNLRKVRERHSLSTSTFWTLTPAIAERYFSETAVPSLTQQARLATIPILTKQSHYQRSILILCPKWTLLRLTFRSSSGNDLFIFDLLRLEKASSDLQLTVLPNNFFRSIPKRLVTWWPSV